MHYINTGEPWNGDAPPTINDPLYLSLADELRGKTDDKHSGEPDGDPWTFLVPTSLVYLDGSEQALPDIPAERAAAGYSP